MLKSIDQLRELFFVGEKFKPYFDFKKHTFSHACQEINNNYTNFYNNQKPSEISLYGVSNPTTILAKHEFVKLREPYSSEHMKNYYKYELFLIEVPTNYINIY
jgi:predicted PolB exonuclease-like 3'-5' exonuclease